MYVHNVVWNGSMSLFQIMFRVQKKITSYFFLHSWCLRTPSLQEEGMETHKQDRILIDRVFLLVPAQAYVGEFLTTFQEYPPRQKAASFSLEKVMEKLLKSGGSK